MFAILGATGTVGRATCETLRAADKPVRAIVHDAAKANAVRDIGCEVVAVDLQDRAALAQATTGAVAVQVIVPLRPQVDDPAADMHRSIASIVAALEQARPARVLAISDYGAHLDRDVGMPSIFIDLERRLAELDGRKILVRSAEHMHNWGRSIVPALSSGTLPSFQIPNDMAQPTVAARDLGRITAELLLHDGENGGLRLVHVEGPGRYSADDVATALSALSHRMIAARPIPRSEWTGAFAQVPQSLAKLLTAANDAKNEGGLIDIEPGAVEVIRGETALVDELRSLMPPP